MSARSSLNSAGFLTFTLHAHLPYVVNHGTWPHGMEWLHEAAAETYLPLLRVLGRLERDGIGLHCNLNISPVLLEQLTHPVFMTEFPNYVGRKIVAAREDEAFFLQSGEMHFAETARFWHRFFTQALEDFQALGGNIVSGFRRFHEAGLIDIITCAATHGYLPLLGTDESVRAQIRTAVDTHIRHIGQHPTGIWAPECGYRPAGLWSYPVQNQDGTPIAPAFERIGVEQALSESHLKFFFVDTHLVEDSEAIASPYELRSGVMAMRRKPAKPVQEQRSLYRPWYAAGIYEGADGKLPPTAIFPRDPRTGLQVWSGEHGYPGDGNYVDFHKKRWPGGHRYWRVTGARVDMGNKEPYYPHEAEGRVHAHAAHFAALVQDALHAAPKDSLPPILCAPFDAELFGHWWFEGPLWLEAVARLLHDNADGPQLISAAAYLKMYPPTASIAMHEGSWGAEGNNQVWLNPETSWTYTHIYPAELYVRELATGGHWKRTELGTRIAQQLCRELLLLESSDWQFLITTGAARDYAELRFLTHNEQFLELKAIWEAYEAAGELNEHQHSRLDAIQLRDGIFPDIDPALWAKGSRE
ncbi:1,4-alpha-glucan branching enzyme [Granulicella rosea]|uniref:1,4-alpha-glucan branching enzyme n=1 Tax=Granulicella rosea TaxID=474952 RepID=A0A239L3X8_9BACT|nr:1,4-alpha-glucan branching enzyme [Granulicella rosea]